MEYKIQLPYIQYETAGYIITWPCINPPNSRVRR